VPRAPATRLDEQGKTPGVGRSAAIALVLVALVGAVYGQVSGFAFVNFDDGRYVYDNAHVRAGLSRDGVRWAFTTVTASNWHPLTWLSHMLDVELFGVEPGRHHAVNALLHAGNSVLLFHRDGFFAIPAYPVTKFIDPTGAGDSYAGALIGYLASVNRSDFPALKKAVAYATACASLTVESFSVNRLSAGGRKSVDSRLKELEGITRF